MTSHIAAEAASVAKELFAFLVTFIHLTLSFDAKVMTKYILCTLQLLFHGSHTWLSLILTGSSTDAETIFDRMKDVCTIFQLL